MAIKDLGGRVRSEQTKDEIARLLQTEFSNLSDEEKQTVLLCLQELDDPAYNDMEEAGEVAPTRIYDVLTDAEYIRKPVDIETFVMDPYYLGKTCDVLYPKLLTDVKELFSGGYHEAILAGCVDLDAVTQSSNGSLRTIGERLGGDDRVVAFDPSGFIHANARVVSHSGKRKVIRMQLANGMAQKLTPDHRVMTFMGEYQWVPIGELSEGDWVVTPRRIHTVPDSNLSIPQAKLLAYWCGDGSSSDQRSRFKDGNPATSLEVVELLNELGFSGHRYPVSDKCWEVYVEKHKQSGFLDWLRSHEGHRKTADVIVPESVCRAGNDVVASFLNRLWACEGCVYFNPSKSAPGFTLGMTSERFIRQVQLLLLRFGVASRIRLTPQHDRRSGKTCELWSLTVKGVGPMRKFFDSVGPILGKEANCARIAEYCAQRKENTNVDVIPMGHKALSNEMTDWGITRSVSSRWWNLARNDGKLVSRKMFDEWLLEFGHTDLGVELNKLFPADFCFERIVSIESAGEIEVGDICDVEHSHSFISNGICSHNSIGWGKSFTASIAACRVIYELSCMRDPHKSFSLGKGSDISMVVLSVNEDLAIKVAFDNIVNKIKESDYFKENFPFRPLKSEIIFPDSIQIAARASTDTAALGLNVFAAFIDEGNFLQPFKKKGSIASRVGNTDRAQHLYDQLIRRMKSRFQKHGRLPGMMIIVSSKQTRDDFTAKRIRDSKDDPTIFVRDYATWHVKPEGTYSKETFQVLVGNDLVPSKILSPDEVEVVRAKLGEGMLVIDVPIDFRRDFENNLEDSIRDIAGVETVSISPFIQRRELIVPCIDKNRQHPFTVVEWVQTNGGGFAWGKFARQVEVREGAQILHEWQPVYHPEATRYVHIDSSLTGDSTGIAVGCVTGYKTVVRTDQETKEKFTERAPEIWVDFMLRINPPIGGEIDLGLVRQLVYQLQAKGFVIGFISMDQWNSASSLQTFQKKGLSAEIVSVDRPMDAYDITKQAIYEGRLSFYDYEPLLEELKWIQKDNIRNKVDHPAGKSKDVADALAGIVFTLTTKYIGAPLGVMKGISQHADPIAEEQRDLVEEDIPMLPFLQG